MSDQLPLVEGTQNKALSQWFTPRETAARIVQMAQTWPDGGNAGRKNMRVLEPSAGIGRLALELAAEGHQVTCVDIDPENCVRLRRHAFDTVCRDFLQLTPLDLPHFDVAVMNPPFEGGQTEKHIMHALKFADRVVCHCPLTTLAGKARREGLWSEVQLRRLAICSTRPKYGAAGGKTDMCTIDVTLRDPRESRDATDIEWWP